MMPSSCALDVRSLPPGGTAITRAPASRGSGGPSGAAYSSVTQPVKPSGIRYTHGVTWPLGIASPGRKPQRDHALVLARGVAEEPGEVQGGELPGRRVLGEGAQVLL